ncbi:MAG: hypothetical protein JWR07_1957 [Nevskia sp.]|nr:hypothetical protein [Nevskia sp.]
MSAERCGLVTENDRGRHVDTHLHEPTPRFKPEFEIDALYELPDRIWRIAKPIIFALGIAAALYMTGALFGAIH